MQPYAGNKRAINGLAHVTVAEALILCLLGIGSFSTGFYFKDQFIGFGSDYLSQSILVLNTYTDVLVEFLAPSAKIYPLIGSALILLLLLGVSYKPT